VLILNYVPHVFGLSLKKAITALSKARDSLGVHSILKNHSEYYIKCGYRVGPRQLVDFMDEGLKKEAIFSLRRAFSGVKLPI